LVSNSLLHKDKKYSAYNAKKRHFVINCRQNFILNRHFVIKNLEKWPFSGLASRLKTWYVNGDNKAVHTDNKLDY